MQNIILTLSPCGCPRLFIGDVDVLPIPLIDSNLRPSGSLFIGWIEFIKNDVPERRNIGLAFPNDAAALTYLNTTFVENWDYEGVFTIEESFIIYSNNEKFEKAEIMIQYGLKNLVCTIGDAIPGPNVDIDAAFDNGSVFASEIFAGLSMVQVKISGVPLQPVDGPTGFVYLPDDGSDPIMGVITTGSDLQDCIMEVIFTQISQA